MPLYDEVLSTYHGPSCIELLSVSGHKKVLEFILAKSPLLDKMSQESPETEVVMEQTQNWSIFTQALVVVLKAQKGLITVDSSVQQLILKLLGNKMS